MDLTLSLCRLPTQRERGRRAKVQRRLVRPVYEAVSLAEAGHVSRSPIAWTDVVVSEERSRCGQRKSHNQAAVLGIEIRAIEYYDYAWQHSACQRQPSPHEGREVG